jgi:hypothetical protein
LGRKLSGGYGAGGAGEVGGALLILRGHGGDCTTGAGGGDSALMVETSGHGRCWQITLVEKHFQERL